MPKEYLEAIDWLLANETIYRGKTRLPISPALRNIKQALLRAQELEKVIYIINEKCVGIFQLTCCKNVDEYNDLKFVDYEKLTKEEFGLLKRYVGRIFKEELKDA